MKRTARRRKIESLGRLATKQRNTRRLILPPEGEKQSRVAEQEGLGSRSGLVVYRSKLALQNRRIAESQCMAAGQAFVICDSDTEGACASSSQLKHHQVNTGTALGD
jgi:hypothetical protein